MVDPDPLPQLERPRASVRSYVDAGVELVRLGEGYALRAGEVSLGSLIEPSRSGPGRCVTAEGTWDVSLTRSHRLVASIAGTSSVVGTYVSGWLPGGPVVLVDGPRFRLTPPFLTGRWRLRRGRSPRGSLVLVVAPSGGDHVVKFGDAASDLYQLALVTVLSLQAFLLEARLPVTGAAGVAPGP